MNQNAIEKLELYKILSACSEFAVLDGTKKSLTLTRPSSDLEEVRARLEVTAECDRLLFKAGAGKIEYFTDVTDALTRAAKGSALSCGELLEINALLRSARVFYTSVAAVPPEDVPSVRRMADNVYFDANLENDVQEKIIAADKVSDYASDALYTIRTKIRSLNERIRSSLAEYASGKDREYLQDGIVTIRNDRYVIPVKAEHKSKIKGFVHDRSASGATFFIEPEYVLNLNNELVALTIDEKDEVERILKALSLRVGAISQKLEEDMALLSEADGYFARAEYAYSIKAICPRVNARGYINIVKGRHPLIDKKTAVPVSVELGKDYSYLLLSGANTGGKTVTLKMVGLFCLMAECGLFIPAAENSEVCAFKEIFCDVGDSQSIEQSLSTFSSHITNVISICEGASEDSLVLIDELGGGTNPDEGQALAKAVCEHLVKRNSKGIVTTHFTSLKEFAYTLAGLQNASMQFDSATLKPLYKIKIGMPGASNALAISRRLGMPQKILFSAESYLSEEGRNYENVIKRAEESEEAAAATLQRARELEALWSSRVAEAEKALASLEKEKRALSANARAESRRIINERTARAEELLQSIEEIFAKEELTRADLIAARTLKNKLKDEAYESEQSVQIATRQPATKENLKTGVKVFVESLQAEGTVLSFNPAKGEAEVACGSMRVRVPVSGLGIIIAPAAKNQKKQTNDAGDVRVVRKFKPSSPEFEINVIGKNVEEALAEVENFLDRAITDGLEQVKIIHGVGTGKLRAAITQRLKRHRGVKQFRSGQYGEGEIGVTIVTLK